LSPSQLVKLGIVLKIDQDGSWMKITLNKYCVDEKVVLADIMQIYFDGI